MTIYVQLGNPSPKNSYSTPPDNDEACECCGKTNLRHERVQGPLVTTWSVPEDEKGSPGYYSLLDCFKSLCETDGAWQNHTWDDNPAPLWVASNSGALQMLLAEHFGCPAGQPDDFVPADGGAVVPLAPAAVDPLGDGADGTVTNPDVIPAASGDVTPA